LSDRFYDGLGAPDTIRDLFSPALSFEVVPGFPYGDVYIGWDSVVRDLFGRLLQDFENWRTEASEVFAAGDRVFALGPYSGAPR
jgi:hypothetical protein